MTIVWLLPFLSFSFAQSPTPALSTTDSLKPLITESTQKGSKEFGCAERSTLPEWLPGSKELVFNTSQWHLERTSTQDLVRGTCLWSFNIKAPPGKRLLIHQQSIFAQVNLAPDSAAHFYMETFSPGTSGSKMHEPLRAPALGMSGERLLKAPMRLFVTCGESAQVRINASVVMNPKPLQGKSEVDAVHAVLGIHYEDCIKN